MEAALRRYQRNVSAEQVVPVTEHGGADRERFTLRSLSGEGRVLNYWENFDCGNATYQTRFTVTHFASLSMRLSFFETPPKRWGPHHFA